MERCKSMDLGDDALRTAHATWRYCDAPSGLFQWGNPYTQGVALGYAVLAFQAGKSTVTDHNRGRSKNPMSNDNAPKRLLLHVMPNDNAPKRLLLHVMPNDNTPKRLLLHVMPNDNTPKRLLLHVMPNDNTPKRLLLHVMPNDNTPKRLLLHVMAKENAPKGQPQHSPGQRPGNQGHKK